jgi:L,D-transpeptidase YcbB
VLSAAVQAELPSFAGRRRGDARVRTIAAVILTAVLVLLPCGATAQEGVEAAIRSRVEQLRAGGSIQVEERTIRGAAALPSLYDARGFRPVWTTSGAAAGLEREIRARREDGLDPAGYHLAAIERLASRTRSRAEDADLDLLRSDALLRMIHDLRFGRVNAEDHAADRDLSRRGGGESVVATARRLIDSGGVDGGVSALRPDHRVYGGMMEALAALRRLQAQGGWEPLPAGPLLRHGEEDPRVPSLRRRLAISGDLASDAGERGLAFDPALVDALRSFQRRHGLNPDGILGPATLAALNVPVERRVEQVRTNLERARWTLHDLPRSFVAVNIAGAMVYLVRDGEVTFETRAIVGRDQTRTPVFRATMSYIDLNPTWTVPPGIVGEVLDAIRRDPGYLRSVDMLVLDRAGRPVNVDPRTLVRYDARTFPYVFQQQPGPLNPLGRIKLMFPNRFNVYLHDTPARSLFEREERLFSHGCIRVQDPLALATRVLDEPARWNETTLADAIARGGTRTINLRQPLEVLVLYWTASADPGGEPRFYRDVYGRDPGILRALDR